MFYALNRRLWELRAELERARSGGLLKEDFTWEFATQAPDIVGLDPYDGFLGMPLSRPISLTFNMPMDRAATQAALVLSEEGVIQPVQVVGRGGAFRAFDRLARKTPLLANIRPSGKYLMEDFYYAGGLPALLQRLRALPGVEAAAVARLEAWKAARDGGAVEAALAELLRDYVGRPTPLGFAARLSERLGCRAIGAITMPPFAS